MVTGFPLAALTVRVCTMARSSRRIFGLLFSDHRILLRRGPCFVPGSFYFLGWIWRRGQKSRRSQFDGFGEWVVVVIVGW